jgi:hypothetical protein
VQDVSALEEMSGTDAISKVDRVIEKEKSANAPVDNLQLLHVVNWWHFRGT